MGHSHLLKKLFFIPRYFNYALNLNVNFTLKTLKFLKFKSISTENIFSVDINSTIKFQESHETRY